MSLYPLLSAPSSVVAFSSLPPSGISPLAVSGDGSKILPQFFPHTFFKGLQVEEPSIRSQALQLILSKLEALVVDAESLISNTESATIDKQGIQSLQNWSNGLNSLSQLQTRKIARETVFMLLPSALRLTYECPFLDVQSALTSFISKTEARLGLRVPSPLPVSAFISPSSLIQRNTSDDIRRNLILRSFIAYGRVSNVTNVLAFHPAYLDCFLNTYSVLLHDEGALPLPWRAFISILACARHSCTYYVRRQQDAFIVYGGNPTWLTGLNSQGVPQKIRALTELNALLAHRPWMINAKHIRALTQPSPLPSSNGNNNTSSSLDPWSINELIHAIVILTNFHCSCSIILGCGLCREPDVGILVGRHVCRPIDLGGENPRSNTTTLSNDSTPTPLSPLALNLSHIGIISSDKQPTFSSSSSSSSSAIISTSNMSLSSLRIHSNGVIPSSSSAGGANLSSRGGVSNSEKRIEQDARREADLRARLLRGATNDGDDYLQFSEIGIDENDLLEEARSVSTAGGGGGVTGGRSTKSFGARSITHSPRSSRRTHPQSSPQIKSYGGSIPADTLPNTPLVLNDGIGGIGIDDDAKSRGGWELTRSSSYALDGNEDDVDDDDDDDNDDDFDDETELGWGDKSFVDEDDEEFTKGSGLGNTRVGVSESQFGGTEEEREALSDMINFQRAGLGAEPYTSLSIGIDTDPSDNAPAADTLFGLVSDSADMSTLLESSHQFGDTVEPVQTVDTVHQTELSISMPILAPISGRSDAVSEDGRTTMITSITARGPGTTDDLGTEITSSSTQGGRGGLGGLGGISSTPTVRTSIAAQDRKKYCGQGIIRFTSEPHSVLAVQRAYALRLASANAALATTTTTTTSTISTGTVPYLNISSTTISSDNNNTNNKITSSSAASLSAASSASSSPPPKLNKLSRSERHKARKVRLPPTELRIESLRYRDFDTSEPMLITHDFSWEEHGFDLVARFFPAAAPVLDKQFKIAFDLTYNVFSGTGEYVNTEPFRTAIKMYVLRLFGVRNDHYDYAMVNKFMTIATKTFVKKVVCAPETVTADDFANFSFLFSDDEKVHIILLASEARRQSALLWGLNAVTSVFRGGVV